VQSIKHIIKAPQKHLINLWKVDLEDWALETGEGTKINNVCEKVPRIYDTFAKKFALAPCMKHEAIINNNNDNFFIENADYSRYTRNSSGDEIANVNFLYDDIVHALKMQ